MKVTQTIRLRASDLVPAPAASSPAALFTEGRRSAFGSLLRAVTRWCHDERLASSATSERRVGTMPGNVYPVADEREGLAAYPHVVDQIEWRFSDMAPRRSRCEPEGP